MNATLTPTTANRKSWLHRLAGLFGAGVKAPATRSRKQRRLEMEAFEERIVMSWRMVPPAQMRLPVAQRITLDEDATASGRAAITRYENDFYTFVAPRTGEYTFEARTPNSRMDPILGVYRRQGQVLRRGPMDYNDDRSERNVDSLVRLTLQAGQRYYFGITNSRGYPQGRYEWHVIGPSTPMPPGGDDQFEENDTLNQATNLGTLTARRTLTGLAMRDSADWFRFEMRGTGGPNNYVRLFDFQHAQGDLDMRLFDMNGNEIGASTGVGNEERFELRDRPAGTYFVRVYGHNGATNPSYSLEIDPGTGGGGTPGARNVLYVNFDGATISRADFVRWGGRDWDPVQIFGNVVQNGVRVERFLANRADRDQVINQIIQQLQQDLQPFGITVRRHTGLAVEGAGATTIFVGANPVAPMGLASDIDRGNDNATDIAFATEAGVGSQGTTQQFVLYNADNILHEAGHTYGLHHVYTEQESQIYQEAMGRNYTLNQLRERGLTIQDDWFYLDTAFLDRTFVPLVVNGVDHSDGQGPQNSFRAMMQAFGRTTTMNTHQVFTVSTSEGGVFSVTLSGQADRVTMERLASGAIEVTINGQVYELANGFNAIRIYTQGDARDQIRTLTGLGDVQLTVNRETDGDLTDLNKIPLELAAFWNGSQAGDDTHHGHEEYGGCSCSRCLALSPSADRALADVATLLARDLGNAAPEPTPALDRVYADGSATDAAVLALSQVPWSAPREAVHRRALSLAHRPAEARDFALDAELFSDLGTVDEQPVAAG